MFSRTLALRAERQPSGLEVILSSFRTRRPENDQHRVASIEINVDMLRVSVMRILKEFVYRGGSTSHSLAAKHVNCSGLRLLILAMGNAPLPFLWAGNNKLVWAKL